MSTKGGARDPVEEGEPFHTHRSDVSCDDSTSTCSTSTFVGPETAASARNTSAAAPSSSSSSSSASVFGFGSPLASARSPMLSSRLNSAVVSLNVGGTIFQTRVSTLCGKSDFFRQLFDDGSFIHFRVGKGRRRSSRSRQRRAANDDDHASHQRQQQQHQQQQQLPNPTQRGRRRDLEEDEDDDSDGGGGDDDITIFFDHNPDAFRFILDYLRYDNFETLASLFGSSFCTNCGLIFKRADAYATAPTSTLGLGDVGAGAAGAASAAAGAAATATSAVASGPPLSNYSIVFSGQYYVCKRCCATYANLPSVVPINSNAQQTYSLMMLRDALIAELRYFQVRKFDWLNYPDWQFPEDTQQQQQQQKQPWSSSSSNGGSSASSGSGTGNVNSGGGCKSPTRGHKG